MEEETRYVCGRCGAPVAVEDVEGGRAGIVHEEVLCALHYREFLRKAAMETRILGEDEAEQEDA